ncbi:class I SAM-dependent RNA methyltransferase [Fibrobacter sp. UWEL]|uniref:class I SAM-dependent RNA methyltransferase n=1 Tax=Fibrobacter sp. UWEL TaxID=1896209 RepID=UPI00091C2C16|nr:TRAM domain-containing protein [Fibrobacter sp. UWEL]SHK53353.1 23S rRNA (uracil1939-C5)-methyltransferase [Fibrobacter sp. UWEL]
MSEYKKHFKGPRGDNRKFFGKPREDKKPEIYELRIEKMVQGGEGMARLEDGRVCFVSGALPGELCKVKLTFKKKDFTKGKAIQILEASQDRVEPKCPLYGRCGGCSLQHLSSAKQVEVMEQVERENFRRLAHAELPADFKIHCGSPWGYRNRARVVCRPGISAEGKTVRFGFREQESNDIVGFESCPVLTQGLNEFLKGEGKQIFSAKQEERSIPRELDINIFDNGAGQISYYYRGMHSSEFAQRAISNVEVGGRKIQADASVFFQSNLGLLPELVDAVRNAVDEGLKSGQASNEWLIDLFSGVGFFAAILQDKFKKITTVEREEGCLRHAKVNLSVTGEAAGGKPAGSVENVSAPAEDWLLDHVVDVPATLIVDPPRTGLPKDALEAIVGSSVNRLIYVSCDPVTLARDYAKFATAGFTLKHAEGFAFYPQTPHLEMMFVLARD